MNVTRIISNKWITSGAVILAAVVQPYWNSSKATDLAAFQMTAVDQNDVDLLTGYTTFHLDDVSIGIEGFSLGHSISSWPNGFKIPLHPPSDFVDEYMGSVNPDTDGGYCGSGMVSVKFGSKASPFCYTNGVYWPKREDGTTLIKNGSTWLYTSRNGTKYYFDQLSTIQGYDRGQASPGGTYGLLTKIVKPNGLIVEVHLRSFTKSNGEKFSRIQSVTQNNGLQLKYKYSRDTVPSSTSTSQLSDWLRPVSVTALNNAVDYCNPGANTCSYSRTWPSAQYVRANYTLAITDMRGQITQYRMDQYDRVYKIKPANADNETIEYDHCQARGQTPEVCYTYSVGPITRGSTLPGWIGGGNNYDKIYGVTRNGQYWTYNYQVWESGPLLNSTYTSGVPENGQPPVGGTKTVNVRYQGVADSGIEPQIMSIIEGDGSRGNYEYGTYDVNPVSGQSHITARNRLITYTDSAGKTRSYTYDSRGNVKRIDTTGVDVTARNETAGYDTDCTYPVKCNKANWTKDARQYQTDYQYSTTHGGLLKVTLPAVDGIRPQTRYTYAQKRPRYKNSSGSVVNGPNLIWMLTKESTCRNGAASGSGCATASDEVVTQYDYGPSSGANNLFLRGKTVTANGEVHRTCYYYDDLGHMVSEIPPRADVSSCY